MSRSPWPDSINSPSEIPGTVQGLAVLSLGVVALRQEHLAAWPPNCTVEGHPANHILVHEDGYCPSDIDTPCSDACFYCFESDGSNWGGCTDETYQGGGPWHWMICECS